MSFSQLTRLFALGAAIFFLTTSFRHGWNRGASDFPNYYTGAVLVRQGQPLKSFYDWTWFQRQMNYAGLEQLGAYSPQSPLAMLPLVPFAGFPVRTVKRIWLAVNLGFLVGTFWLLARVTRLDFVQIAALALLGYGTLHFNFLYGQYYVCLLFILTAGFYLLERHKPQSGALFGLAFGLKLYGGPFLLYLAAKKRWKPVAAMMAATLCLLLAAAAIFSWSAVYYFGTQILPRALEGATQDAFSNLYGTLPALLRRTFVFEPELNPHPFWNAPWVYFFLRPLLSLSIVAFPLLAVYRSDNQKQDFAWFFIAVLLASPNTASYTFILLLLPVTLLLDQARPKERIFLVLCYALLAIPLRPLWSWFFPKLWLLGALYFVAGRGYWRLLNRRAAIVALTLITLAAVLSAGKQQASYLHEPARAFERIVARPGEMFSSSPAVLRSGIVYQAIGRDRYVLRWLHDGRNDEFRFDGEALQPRASSPDGPVRFELVSHRRSTMMLLDPKTGSVGQDPAPGSNKPAPAISPDGKWAAFTRDSGGTEQVWYKKIADGAERSLTGGNCNSSSPVWELDGTSLIFTSDCGRGIGFAGLYRARLGADESAPFGIK